MIVGQSDQSKSYQVYIPGYRQIEINVDVTFDEDANFNKARKNHANQDHEAPRATDINILSIQDVEEEDTPEEHEMAEPQRPMESLHEMISQKNTILDS